MAINEKTVEQWGLNDYLEYFSGSGRLFGVAESFKSIHTMMQSKQSMEQELVDLDRLQDWEKNLDEIKAEAERYLSGHKNPMTGEGKKRVEVMNALVGYCNREKRLTDPEAHAKLFTGKPFDTLRKGAAFDDVKRKLEELAAVEAMPMTPEHAISYANKVLALVETAESYVHANRIEGRLPRQGRSAEEELQYSDVSNPQLVYYDYTMALIGKYKPCLDSIRDVRKVKEVMEDISKKQNRNAVWDDLLEVRPAEYVHTGKVEVVGAAVSERMKITYNGKKGFFTAYNTILTNDQIFDRSLEMIGEQKVKDDILENRHILESLSLETKNTYFRSVAYKIGMCKIWDHMEPSPQKDMLKTLLKNPSSNTALDKVITEYKSRIEEIPSDQLSELKKMQMFDQVIKDSRVDSNLKAMLTVNAKSIRTYAEQANEIEEYNEELSLYQATEKYLYMDMLNADLSIKEGRECFEKRQAMVRNSASITAIVDINMKMRGSSAAQEQGHLECGDELSKRNVASTRIAELLGVGRLLAHSEKMTVTMPDGKQVEGSFMEFAEGLDLRNIGENARTVATEVDFSLNAGYTKDACSIEILDYICAQGDRHGGNMFVKLGEPGPDGKRNIVGIQGIDNDLAFSKKSLKKELILKQGNLKDLYFIDEEMANQIRGIDREKIVTAVGDLLSDKEIDALVKRVDDVQKRLDKEMIILKGEEWNLDADPKTFGDKSEIYEKAIKEIQDSFSAKQGWDKKHKNAYIKDELFKIKQAYNKQLAAEKETPKAVKADTMKAEQEIRAQRAALFDKLVSEKGKVTKTAGFEAKIPSEKVAVSINELSGPKRENANRGFKFGAAREAARKKEVETDIEVITEAEIAEANRKVKKPIIGSHRK